MKYLLYAGPGGQAGLRSQVLSEPRVRVRKGPAESRSLSGCMGKHSIGVSSAERKLLACRSQHPGVGLG